MKQLALLSLMVALSACGANTKVISDTSDNVTIRMDDDLDSLNEATAKANSACAKKGKLARFQNVADVEDEKVAIYSCVTQ